MSSEQLQLLPDDVGAVVEALEAAGEFTLERVKARKPETCRLVVDLLRGGFGIIRIAELLHISVNTVSRLRDDAGIKPEEQTAGLAKAAGMVAALSAERLIDRLSDKDAADEIPARDLAIIHGVGVDKAQLLSGGATVRVEHQESGPSIEAALEEYRRLQAAAIDITHSVEIGPCAGARDGQSNGLVGMEPAPKGGSATSVAIGPGSGDTGARAPSSPGVSDKLSDGLPRKIRDSDGVRDIRHGQGAREHGREASGDQAPG
jgi:hypothetical protein